MSIPSRAEAARLLLSLDPPPWHLRHSRAVADIAGWLARAVAERHDAIDRSLVEAAALLHDVDKLQPVKAKVGSLPHGEGSAAWLSRRDHGELAAAVAAHPVTRFADGKWFDRWISTAPTEVLIVAYADKRAGQRLESMASRFAGWERRFPPEGGGETWSAATLANVRARAEELERRVTGLADVRPEQVQRLPWTASALRRVRA